MLLLLSCYRLFLTRLFFRQISFVETCKKFSVPQRQTLAERDTANGLYAHLRASSSKTMAGICSRFCFFFALITLCDCVRVLMLDVICYAKRNLHGPIPTLRSSYGADAIPPFQVSDPNDDGYSQLCTIQRLNDYNYQQLKDRHGDEGL